MRQKTKQNFLGALVFFGIVAVGSFFSLYHINFGLPHSFYADEPEISEFAIKYTYEIRDVVRNNNWYKLVPVSYVYGTFPIYFLTVAVMGYSKLSNLLSLPFDKTSLFVFIRVLTALSALSLIPVTGMLFYKMRNNRFWALSVALLVATNWKFIVHAHYANQDIFLTLLITASLLSFFYYYQSQRSLHLIVTAVLFGLAAGTKITALIAIPLYLYVILTKKDVKGSFAFVLIVAGVFALTNPFSLIFHQDFIYRILSMLTKEGGMVFDSVDTNPFKYLYALEAIVSLPLLVISLYGMLTSRSDKKIWWVFLVGYILVYVVFYSGQARRVDRWLLPIIPIILLFTVTGMEKLSLKLSNKTTVILLAVLVGIYMYKPILLLTQFKRWTPKSEAYLWMQKNTPQLTPKLVYTEEGLDPMNKLELAKVHKYQVYSSENAQLFYPEDPLLYEYVVISSRPMENHTRYQVRATYPDYSKKWDEFVETLENQDKFTLLKQFSLSKPNLIPLSDVFIYQRVKTQN